MNGSGIIDYTEAQPLALCTGFQLVFENETPYVICFLYKFESEDLNFCVCSPSMLGFQNDQFDIFLSGQDTQKIRVNFAGKFLIQNSKDDWEMLVEGHVRWMAELYSLSESNREYIRTAPKIFDTRSDQTLKQSMKDAEKLGDFKNYLILPSKSQNESAFGRDSVRGWKESCIDVECIENFVNNGFTRKINRGQICNPDETILSAKYAKQAPYTIDFVVRDTLNETALSMKQRVQQLMKIEDSEEQSYFDQTFGFDDQILSNMKVSEFFKKVPKNSKAENYSSLRTIDECHNFKPKDDDQIYFLSPLKKAHSFDYCSELQNSQKSSRLTCKETNTRRNFKTRVICLARRHLSYKTFSVELFNSWTKIPSILTIFEQKQLSYSLKVLYSLKTTRLVDNVLWKATQSSSCSLKHNYETLETIGDSVLKLITIYQLIATSTPDLSEGQLTSLKGALVSNIRLAKIGVSQVIYPFLKTKSIFRACWRPALIEHESQNSKKEVLKQRKSKCHFKQVADFYEGIIGGIFHDNETLEESYRFILSTGFWYEDKIRDPKVLVNSGFLDKQTWMNSKKIITEKHNLCSWVIGDKRIAGEIAEDITYRELFSFQKNDGILDQNSLKFQMNCLGSMLLQETHTNPQLSSDINEFIEAKIIPIFEDFIGYKFTDRSLIRKALTISRRSHTIEDANHPLGYNLEKLEFLGDAIFEAGTMCSVFAHLNSEKKEFTPNNLQAAKIFTLSNMNMAKYCVLSNYHHFIISENQELLADLHEACTGIELMTSTEKCLKIEKHKIRSPKVIGDVWEAICGALMIDGGWDAVYSVIGQKMAPFVMFFCKFFQKMKMNYKSEAMEIMQKTDFRIEQKKAQDYSIVQVFKGNELLEEFSSINPLEAEEEAFIFMVYKNLEFDQVEQIK